MSSERKKAKELSQNKKPCVVCGNREVDRAHIRSKGAGGTWDDFNILWLCRTHHVHQHQYGFKKFCEKYPDVEEVLLEKGWKFNSIGKLERI